MDTRVALTVEDDGSGVKEASVELRGPQGLLIRRVRELPPFEFDVSLREGVWVLDARAVDHAGNEASATRAFTVGALRGRGGCSLVLGPSRELGWATLLTCAALLRQRRRRLSSA